MKWQNERKLSIDRLCLDVSVRRLKPDMVRFHFLRLPGRYGAPYASAGRDSHAWRNSSFGRFGCIQDS
jgi:hypothetical protein